MILHTGCGYSPEASTGNVIFYLYLLCWIYAIDMRIVSHLKHLI